MASSTSSGRSRGLTTTPGVDGKRDAGAGMSRRGERLGHAANMAVNLRTRALVASASRGERCGVCGDGDCKLILGQGWVAEAK